MMNSANSKPTIEGKLVDFDWQIRHVLGSNTSRNLEESLTLLSFILKTEDESCCPVRNINIEFNKSELKQLISTLQRSVIHKMVLSELEEISEKHQQLCADLNMDKETSKTSWTSYLQTKHNYTLEGDQLHWLACAIYVACRRSLVPAVGRVNTFIEGNLVSLTRLLRLCGLTPLQFIDNCRKWADMVHLTNEFKGKITALERKFAVSAVVFKKFKSMFNDMFDFQDADPVSELEKTRMHKKKSLSCPARLKEFLWTLYLVVKSDFTDINDDLVSSYHLLLACCDLVYANAICSDRRDILNRKFIGIPPHFFDDDFDPPTEPICIIDELCKIYEGISIEAKSLREYSFKSQIKKLFERDVLRGDASQFLDILNADVFDYNFRSINRVYEQYVLSVGDFDERVVLQENLGESNELSQSTGVGRESVCNSDSNEDMDRPPSIIHPNTLTPLTGRQYLRNRDGVNMSGMTPMMSAKDSVIRLHGMLKMVRTPFQETLKEIRMDITVITELENEIKSKVNQMISLCRPAEECLDKQIEQSTMYFSRKRLEVAEKLFYKMLDDIIQSEVKMIKPEVGESVRQDLFLRSLFACAVEIVFFSYGCAQLKFPWILDALQLPAYHFYKIIELVVRTETQLTRDMVKHLNMLEEKILDSLAWSYDSPVWRTIEESNMPVPSCEDVCLPHQLSSFDGSIQENETLNTYVPQSSKTDHNKLKPKRGGSLGLFFRKFYHLASVRMQDLCSQLNINEREVRMKIWTCFEHVIVSTVDLMKNRHLDQILMCTVYVACKVLEINLTFQEIMKCYRTQPQSASHVYRNVLLVPVGSENQENAPEERGDLIKFYNSVFVKVIQNFALKFSSRSNNKGEPLILSPLPVPKSKTNSPFRRVSDKHLIYIRCLDNTDNIAPSPVKPLSYYFSRSPAKDLHAINNMMAINSVKRSLVAMEDEGPPIKKFNSRSDTSKLQDMIEDRRKYQL